MKRHYSKPITRCLQIRADNLLFNTSVATSDQRYTDESFSRQQQYDDWDEE